jgi:hypothetical protein
VPAIGGQQSSTRSSETRFAALYHLSMTTINPERPDSFPPDHSAGFDLLLRREPDEEDDEENDDGEDEEDEHEEEDDGYSE